MGFPHFPWPLAPSQKLWLRQIFVGKLPAGHLFRRKWIRRESAFWPFSGAPNKWRSNEGRRLRSPKFRKELFYKDYKHGCPTLNRSLQINFQIPVHIKFHLSRVEKIGKKNLKKCCFRKMGFPHLLWPPEPSLEIWLWQIFSRKLPAGLRPFSYLFTNKYAANLLCYRFRRPLIN